MKIKLNRQEIRWVVYDIGNSAFILLVSTILPIYFNSISSAQGIPESSYLSYWSYATSISTLAVAILGPILGTLADYQGKKKKVFLLSALCGALALACFWVPSYWLSFLILFIVAKICYSLSLIFYDSMLTDVTTEERMDEVSSRGYAWGSIGSCVPFLISLALVLFYETLGISMNLAMSIAFLLIAVWWVCFAVPLLRSYKQLHCIENHDHAVSSGLRRLGHVFGELKKNKKILFFLIAFFFYIDGVYTIIDMATAYGTALGLDTTGLLLALLVTQIVAFPAALIFGRLSGKYKNASLIKICIAAYFLIALYGITLKEQYQFWILAVCVGIFQGAIQSLSRSYFARIIPAERSGEYFGIYDICGKGASFLGTTLVSAMSQLTGNMNLGVGSLAVMFLIGFFFFLRTEKLS